MGGESRGAGFFVGKKGGGQYKPPGTLGSKRTKKEGRGKPDRMLKKLRHQPMNDTSPEVGKGPQVKEKGTSEGGGGGSPN